MRLRKKLRKMIRRIPLLRARSPRPPRQVEEAPRRAPFPGSRAYWEERYAGGGNSGAGSYTKFADFKAEILNDLVAAHRIDSVVEFGCGDGNQLLLASYPRYLGLDVSATAVDLCRDKFSGDHSKSFKLLEHYAGETADLALSLDVIYHLTEDAAFERHMATLFAAATRFVVIYSSDTDHNPQWSPHIRHRQFSRWIADHAVEWSLDRRIPNRYPYTGDHTEGSFADFHLYRRTRAA